MKVHSLQHVDYENLAYIATWLNDNKHPLTSTLFFNEHYQLPDPGAIDALIVMGGPMSIYDEAQFPWLKDEKAFIKDCIEAGKKVLGICLGAQLIADCLGAKVSKAAHKEIGWFPVAPAGNAGDLPWFYELFKDQPVVFHWHGDSFDIPAGCLDLLSSRANSNQAFTFNEKVIGLQFHLEITAPSLVSMVENGSGDLAGRNPYVQRADELAANTAAITGCNRLMNKMLGYWAGA